MDAVMRRKFPRRRLGADLGRAEQVLFEEMEHAAELLQSEEDFGRSSVRHAIHACYSFLHVRGLSGQALKPLLDLILAFESRDRGVLSELFDPRAKRGSVSGRKWSRSLAAAEIKIHAAACMDALMDTGVAKDEAAARVARQTGKWPRFSEGHIKGTTVANWRDELLQRVRDDRERKRFEQRSAMFSQGPRAKERLSEALRIGPVLTGGVRRRGPEKT